MPHQQWVEVKMMIKQVSAYVRVSKTTYNVISQLLDYLVVSIQVEG
jgi:hypothetical protein